MEPHNVVLAESSPGYFRDQARDREEPLSIDLDGIGTHGNAVVNELLEGKGVLIPHLAGEPLEEFLLEEREGPVLLMDGMVDRMKPRQGRALLKAVHQVQHQIAAVDSPELIEHTASPVTPGQGILGIIFGRPGRAGQSGLEVGHCKERVDLRERGWNHGIRSPYERIIDNRTRARRGSTKVDREGRSGPIDGSGCLTRVLLRDSMTCQDCLSVAIDGLDIEPPLFRTAGKHRRRDHGPIAWGPAGEEQL